ncbi:MAG: ABC transporter substrate-binding protein [Actinomycetia bacterium]|nr:ABC transporter substrate-binding protein [Actinomycetes bacterium]
MIKQTRTWWRLLATLMAFTLVAAACGSDGDDGEDEDGAASGEEGDAGSDDLTPVKLQLQWVPQSQFAGYFAARDLGFYEDVGLDVTIIDGGVDIVPATVLDSGGADFAISWVPRGLVPREEGLNITNIAQVFQRSGTLQVSFVDSGITSVADLEGKNVGNWGFGNEFELFAGLRANGLDPQGDVTLVQQDFNMTALINGDIDAAQAMIYNEYAQVLETINPDTGELFQPEDLNVIDWNDVGTAMLQDAIWADADRLDDDAEYREIAVKFVEASLRGWAHCRDNSQECVDVVVDAGPPFGGPAHQAWMMNEINALVWPSPAGVGIMDAALYDQTVTIATEEGILSAAPDEGAFRTDIAEEAVANLEAAGIDVFGNDFARIDVEVVEGGE